MEILGDTSNTINEKDLGVTISADMIASEQCGIAASKGNPNLAGINKGNITYMEKQLIILPYEATVRPHLEYSTQTWIPYDTREIGDREVKRRLN